MARDPKKGDSPSKRKRGKPKGASERRGVPKRPQKRVRKAAAKSAKAAKRARAPSDPATLKRQLNESRARQTATAEILKIIASSPDDVQPVFKAIVRTIVQVLRCDRAFIMRCEGKSYYPVANALADGTFGFVDLTRAEPIDPAVNFPSRAIVSKKSVYYPDRSLIELPEYERTISEKYGVNSSLLLPLLRQDECIGVLALASKGKNTFSPSDIALAESFRDQALIAIENARLFNETREALAQQTATSEVLEVISSSMGDVQPVFEQMLEKATHVCGAEFGVMGLYEGEMYRRVALYNVPPAFAAMAPKEFRPNPDGPIGTPRRTGQVFRLDDLSKSEAYLSRHNAAVVAMVEVAGVRTIAIVPMMKDGDAVGAIAIYRQEVRPFTDRQIELLKNFANQAVIAIENARLFNETREALERQTATADILKVIASSPDDVQPVFDAIAEHANRLIGGHATSVVRIVGDVLELVAHTYLSEEADVALRAAFPIPIAGLPQYELMLRGEVTEITDTEADVYVHYSRLRQIARAAGFRSRLMVPLKTETGTIGAIAVTRIEPGQFAEHHIQLLKTFADQAVIAIQNVRLFNETKEALEYQKASAGILSVISSSVADTQPVFDAILHSAEQLFGAEQRVIFLIGEDERIHVAAVDGPDAERTRVLFPQPLKGSVSEQAFRERRVMTYDDVYNDPDVPPVLRDVSRRFGQNYSLALAPMLRDGRGIGSILVSRLGESRRPFNETECNLLRSFADQAVVAIENARLFNETREALARQTATADVLKVIASSPSNLQPVFDAIAERSKELVGGHSTTVFRFAGDMVELVAATSVNAEADAVLRAGFPRPIPAMQGLERTFRGETLETVDAAADTESESSRNIARARGFRSRLVVPLNSDNGVIGAISITRSEPGAFANKDVELLRTFADQAVIAIQNVKLFEEVQAKTRDLEESLQQQTATADVLKVISRSAFDLDAVMDTLASSAQQLCEAEGASLFLRDGDVLVSRGVATYENKELWRGNPVPINEDTHMGRAVLTGTVANIGDFENDPHTKLRKFQQQLGFKAFLAVPLMREGRGVGVFVLTRNVVGEFTSRQVELVQTFADQAVIAIENTRLFNETTEALARQTATADVLKVIASSPSNLQPVFDAIAERSKALIGAHSTTVVRYIGGMMELAAFTPVSPEADEVLRAMFPMRPIAGDPQTEQILRGEIARIADAESELQNLAMRETARARGWRSRLLVSLKDDTGVIGWISIARKEAGPFADKDVELLRTFADQAVIAIQNVELFEEVQARTRDLQESLEQQTATAEILSSISGSMNDTKPVFDAIVRNLLRLFGTRFAVVQTLDQGIVEMPAVDGEPGFERLRERYPRPLAPDTVGGIAMLEKRTLQFHPVLGNPAAPATTQQFARDFGFDSVLFNPMLSGDKVVGAIGVARHEAVPFDEKQIALIASFANQAVIAIENTRLLRALQERTDALTRSLDDLRAAQDRLVQTEKLASLGQLTAGIAHEIKNPLNFVNNFSALSVELTDELNDLLKQAELAEKLKQEIGEITQLLKSNLEKVVQHGKRADSIVKNMLLHSREGSGEQRAADVNALVEESLNLAYHGARAEKSGFNITLQREFDAGAGSAELYPQEITRALLNLISNGFYAAIRRKAENGDAGFEPLLLATTKDLGHSVEIRIRDNGTGIPPEVKEKMFNPFFTTKPAGEGTGLGLSMTHDIIVKQHGGTIDVATEPGNFTEFIVVLPRANGAPKNRGQA